MNKQEIIDKYTKPEERLLASKIIDKIEECKNKNRITNTDFLDMYERSIAEKIVSELKANTVFFGGFDGAERTILITYPEKITEEIVENMYSKLVKAVKIVLPDELYGKYVHKNYLGAVMKLGIKREKVGDIKVSKEGADIIVQSDMAEYISNQLADLTRFSKSSIEIIDIDEIRNAETQFQELTIIIPSMRLDCIVRRNY